MLLSDRQGPKVLKVEQKHVDKCTRGQGVAFGDRYEAEKGVRRSQGLRLRYSSKRIVKEKTLESFSILVADMAAVAGFLRHSGSRW